MKQLGLSVVVVIASAAGHLGCGSSSLSSGGRGGATGTTGFGGAVPSTGGRGAAGAGGMIGAGGTGDIPGAIQIIHGASCLGDGAGGSPPAWDGGLPPVAVDGGASVIGCDVVPSDPVTFPWIIEVKTPGGQSGAAGAAGSSGCHATFVGASSQDIVCGGAAWLSPSGGVGGAGGNVPSLTWDDGSKMSWEPHALDPAIPPPISDGTPDQRVWADLQIHQASPSGAPVVTVGPALTSQPAIQALTIHDNGSNGPIRFMALQGTGVTEPSGAQLNALFGVTAETVPVCSFEQRYIQDAVRLTFEDHILQTSPPQRIQYGPATRVTAPNGVFGVIWYARDQQVVSAYCGAGVLDSPAAGFLAARIASP